LDEQIDQLKQWCFMNGYAKNAVKAGNLFQPSAFISIRNKGLKMVNQ